MEDLCLQGHSCVGYADGYGFVVVVIKYLKFLNELTLLPGACVVVIIYVYSSPYILNADIISQPFGFAGW